MHLLSFVIPCYRSEKTIRMVYQEIVEVVSQREDFDYEIIAVNDCSPDGVLKVLKELAAEDERFKVVDLAKNFGKHGAVMAGFSRARGELIVNLDDDFQCPTYELWKLVDPILDEGYDCAIAQYEKKQESLWKRFGSAVNKQMIRWLLEQPQGIKGENFLVMRKYVCDEMRRYHNPYPNIEGLLLRTTHRIKMVPMDERKRGDDNSTGFTLRKSFSLLVNGLTAFSVKPLRIATVAGFVFAVLGFLYGVVVIIRKLINPAMPVGYSSLMAIHLFSSGMIMLILGIAGEYVGRIYICLNNSPQYVIRETINMDDQKGEQP